MQFFKCRLAKLLKNDFVSRYESHIFVVVFYAERLYYLKTRIRTKLQKSHGYAGITREEDLQNGR